MSQGISHQGLLSRRRSGRAARKSDHWFFAEPLERRTFLSSIYNSEWKTTISGNAFNVDFSQLPDGQTQVVLDPYYGGQSTILAGSFSNNSINAQAATGYGLPDILSANLSGDGNTFTGTWSTPEFPTYSTEYSVPITITRAGTNTTDTLSVTKGPTDTGEGDTIDPVKVAQLSATGTINTGATGSVTVQISSTSTGTGSLTGTTAASFAAGVATFSNLRIDAAGQYSLTFTDSAGDTTNSGLFQITPGKLVFPATPAATPAATVINPAVTVQVQDIDGSLDTSATGTITLALTGTQGATLGGTLTQPITGGVATFNDLTVSKNGVYKLNATDSEGDANGISNQFKIGQTSLSLAIISRNSGGKNGVVTGDVILYSVLPTAHKTLQSQVVVVTLPLGIIPTGITGGGVFSGNTIRWNPITQRVNMNFDIKVPNAALLSQALSGGGSINITAVDNVVYTDDSEDVANASNSVKLDLDFQVTGNLFDVIYQYPQIQRILTDVPLAGVKVNLIDDSGDTAASTVTAGGGKFTLKPTQGGSYTLEFVAVVSSYTTAINALADQQVIAGKDVEIPLSNTKATPVKAGDCVLPRAFLNQAAKTLNSLNNYTSSQFQGLAAFNLDLFQFNTTGAETALSSLFGSVASPTALLAPAALKASGATDPWVSAMRMMAGLAEVNLRFADTFKLADACGRAVAVLAGASVAKAVGKFAGSRIRNSQSLFNLFSISTTQRLLATSTKITSLTATGAELPLFMDDLSLHPSFAGATKNAIYVIVFNTLRYAADILSGQLLADLGFETVFNLVRLVMDAAMVEVFAGVTVRTDLAAPWSQIGAATDYIGSLQTSASNMQDAIDTSVNNRSQYSTASDTNQMLEALGRFDDYLHLEGVKGLRNFGFLNGISSFLRGTTGILEVQGVIQNISPLPQGQAMLQNGLTQVNGAFSSASGKSVSQLQTDALLGALVATLLSLTEQTFYTFDVPTIVSTGTFSSVFAEGTSSGSLGGSTGGSSLTPAPVAASPAVESTEGEQPAVVHETAAVMAGSSDTSLFLSDLSQMASLVKAGNAAGIAALYPQFSTDEESLFNNDLELVDSEAGTVLEQLSAASKKAANSFEVALNSAVNSTLLAVLQIDAWGNAPATGNVKAVTAQITAAMKAVSAASRLATAVRVAVVPHAIPVALEIDETNIPLQVSVGTTQSLTFTVTNIGNQTASAGTVTFTNADGSLVLQTPAEQDLAPLPPGASASFTWQVDVINPPDPNNGSVFQVQAVAGSITGSMTDQLIVGSN